MAAVYKSLSRTNGKKVEGEEAAVATGSSGANGVRKIKQRVLILSSRGVTYRHRHLLTDLHSLLPHSRRDAKLDTKTALHQLNELADLYNCNNILFFEARKAKDLYLWLSRSPNGPTVKLHIQNLHTMEELHFPGNCLKGSRPILSFDKQFEEKPHLRLLKEMLAQMFGVPKGARRIKPFVDHVMGFTLADGKVWVRCYQINEAEIGKGAATTAVDTEKQPSKKGKSDETNISLTEIGPRFVMTPIVILEGSFGGPVIYENKEFISPNQIRAELRRGKAGKYVRRNEQGVSRLVKRGELGLRTQGGRRERGERELEDGVLFA